jgi:hypothetical protein
LATVSVSKYLKLTNEIEGRKKTLEDNKQKKMRSFTFQCVFEEEKKIVTSKRNFSLLSGCAPYF